MFNSQRYVQRVWNRHGFRLPKRLTVNQKAAVIMAYVEELRDTGSILAFDAYGPVDFRKVARKAQ